MEQQPHYSPVSNGIVYFNNKAYAAPIGWTGKLVRIVERDDGLWAIASEEYGFKVQLWIHELSLGDDLTAQLVSLGHGHALQLLNLIRAEVYNSMKYMDEFGEDVKQEAHAALHFLHMAQGAIYNALKAANKTINIEADPVPTEPASSVIPTSNTSSQ